ncbi:MAG: sodium/proline symporter [Deltaproteobacteria bacterium]|nr:sodium/proline symporter [Deltaproteobacteria bacterium]
MIVATFVASLLVFVVIGALSMRKSQGTTEDYLVAGRDVPAWLTALSSAATNNSGFMFIGLIGFAYRFGVQAVWLQIGWIVGDVVLWAAVHRRVRERSGEVGASSVPTLIAGGRAVAVVAGVLTFAFLGSYAGAQLQAGSAALHSLFGWDMAVGAVLGAVIVVTYCFSGGLRASIWTDAAQALVMLVAMACLLVVALVATGGPAGLVDALAQQDPALVQWVPDDLAFGFGLYLLGFVFGGLGAVGQPHILIRSMAIESPEAITRARRVYFAWYVPFSAAVVLVGLASRVLLPDLTAGVSPDHVAKAAELALPKLSLALLPDALVGVMLAGLFAATMSTADSQILACSAAVTQDIAPRFRERTWVAKVATLAVAVIALLVALFGGRGVFELVLMSWSALGAALGPLVVLRAFGVVVAGPVALAMMAAGLVTVIAWLSAGLSGAIFELLPGMAAPFLVFAVARALSARAVVTRPADPPLA